MTLYRTYRPQRFSDLYGQDNARLTLQQALLQDRVAHAYLFTGPRGTGKTSTARIFARALTCLKPSTGKTGFEPCNKCAACLSQLESHSTDFIEMDAASNRGIEDIRELRQQVLYPPIQLKRKIYLIDEVHMLTGEAFNALLKTLEEPPPHCLFILATTELHKLPLTIRSRCQLVRFEPGSPSAIQKKLDSIVGKETLKVESGVTALLASHAEGGFRDAETLLESLSTQYSPLSLKQVEQSLGLPTPERISQLLDSCQQGDTTSTVNIIESFQLTSNAQAEQLLSLIINEIRTHLYNNEGLDFYRTALEQLLQAFLLQKHAPTPALPLELACLNVCATVTPSKSIDHHGKIIEATEAPIAPILQTAPMAIAPVIELNQEPIKDIRKAWRRMIEKISKENIAVAQVLKDASIYKAENGLLTVQVRFKFHADRLQERKTRSRIVAILQELTGQEWQIEYSITNQTTPRPHPSRLNDGLVETVFKPEAHV